MTRENSQRFDLNDNFPYTEIYFNPAKSSYKEILNKVINLRNHTLKTLKRLKKEHPNEMEHVDLSNYDKECDNRRVQKSLSMLFQSQDGQRRNMNIWITNRPPTISSNGLTRCNESSRWRRPYGFDKNFDKNSAGENDITQKEVKTLVYKKGQTIKAVIGSGDENNLMPKKTSLVTSPTTESGKTIVVSGTVNPATITLMNVGSISYRITPAIGASETITNNLGSRFLSLVTTKQDYLDLTKLYLKKKGITLEESQTEQQAPKTRENNSKKASKKKKTKEPVEPKYLRNKIAPVLKTQFSHGETPDNTPVTSTFPTPTKKTEQSVSSAVEEFANSLAKALSNKTKVHPITNSKEKIVPIPAPSTAPAQNTLRNLKELGLVDLELESTSSGTDTETLTMSTDRTEEKQSPSSAFNLPPVAPQKSRSRPRHAPMIEKTDSKKNLLSDNEERPHSSSWMERLQSMVPKCIDCISIE